MEALQRLALFQGLPAEVTETLSAGCHILDYPRHAVVFEQDDAPRAVFGVLTGALKVERAQVDGPSSTLTLLGPGDVFGELAFFVPGGRTARVVAVDSSDVVRIEGSRFEHALERSPLLAKRLLRLFAERLLALTEHHELLRGQRAPQRFAARLLFLAQRFGTENENGVGLHLPLSQAELADFADMSRQTVNELLGAWQRHGWLEHRRGSLLIHDLTALRALIGE